MVLVEGVQRRNAPRMGQGARDLAACHEPLGRLVQDSLGRPRQPLLLHEQPRLETRRTAHVDAVEQRLTEVGQVQGV